VTAPTRRITVPPIGGSPRETPIGLLAAQVGRSVDEAFEGALAAVGGSRPAWLILLAIVSGAGSTQSAIAEHVGITDATLVHHLDRLEQAGLVVRNIDPDNRRVRTLSLTASGREAFLSMREAAVDFDARLRQGMSEAQVQALRRLLARLRANSTSIKEEPS
jgi:MarR family transcriptional regulator, transcriptional regulator for hemolysin